ncbi:hypothetical protein BJ973_009215 [Actinoplanes tereljensis]|uniref:Lipoprotein n=1 Tax=Paractinoplanes tereljensis TaxID=571912 RepID=A0A919NFT9_9ACTN|nr:hypothetical protein [Actinoplanes tereljensis]GIF17821.1 hypothetical protein Ate02nite_05510 [Actinoplanes tereljensis]
MRRTAILFTFVVLLAGCGSSDKKEESRDTPIGAAVASSAPPLPVITTSPPPADFTPKVSDAALRNTAIAPASALGTDWKGPAQLSQGFPRIDNFVQNCSQASGLKKRHESLKPRNGAYGFYNNVSQDVSLSQLSTGTGADTTARATAFLAFLRTLPQACPSGKALGKYPYKLAAKDGTNGDEELRLRMTIALPEPYEPLVIDQGYVRQGGLVVTFYGEYTQVDEYLPETFKFAETALAGKVPGV